MRWIVFLIVAVVAVAVDTSKLPELVALHALGEIQPSVVGVIVIFVSLFAPRAVALWAAWAIGLLLDLAVPRAGMILIGPHALGYVIAALIVLQVRTMVFRRRLLTIAALTMVCLAAAGIVEVAIATMRTWFAEAGSAEAVFRPFVELMRRFGVAVYSALLAIPVGWLLVRSAPLWSFGHATERRRGGKSWR